MNKISKLISIILALIGFIFYVFFKADIDHAIYCAIMSIYAKVWSDE